MCGIVGYKGNQKAIPVLLYGLKSLEYRGYDSAGIALKRDKNIEEYKAVGKVKNLEELIKDAKDSNLGIGHTRWATHGGVAKINARPHSVGNITLVHNGIIENYLELKEKLINEGYTFKSETDTEVLCALIDHLNKKNKDLVKTLGELYHGVKGSFAILVLNKDDNKLYAARWNSPLILASQNDEYFLASDICAILKYTNEYYILENGNIVCIDKEAKIFDEKLQKVSLKKQIYEGSIEDSQLNGYEHFMLKEIHEEPKVVDTILSYYIKDNKLINIPDLKKYKEIYIVGCGSAYNTGLISAKIYEKYLNIPVRSFLASEYRYQKHFYNKDTLVIFISQSGETADTLEALRITKKDGIDTLALVNTYASSIAREADKTLYLKCGVEIAVATTKAFTAQLVLLALVMLKIANKEENISDFLNLPELLNNLLKLDYKNYAKKIYQNNNAFFIGRQIDSGLCEEGALKLKEISYINCVSFPAGELKHGTISLIEKNTPVIAITSDESIMEKTISNIKEVKARDAYVLWITNEDLKADFYDDKIVIPKVSDIVQSILILLPLQYIAYEVALLKELPIDKPRNLAKSVTVE